MAVKKVPTVTPVIPYSVKELFTRGYLYEIPKYQRAYSWDCKKNIDDFWKDLETVILYKNETHSFGSIEANDTGNEWEWLPDGKTSAKYPICTISDGQQRLTTFILFYAAYAHHCKLKRKDQTVLHELKRIFFRRESTSKKVRQALKLQENELQRCLDDLIADGAHSKESPSAVRKMKEAFTNFYSRFEALKNNPERDKYFDALMNRSEVIFISSNANEYMKFEVRNNRGSKPNELDRVKNLIELIEFRGKIKGGLKFPISWYESIKLLDQFGLSGQEDQLLKHTMTVTFGKNYEGEMYSKFKEEFWSLTEGGNSKKEKK